MNNNRELRILLVGGGSGGHVYPLIAVARALKERVLEREINLNLMMIGSSFIEKASRETGIPYKIIFSGKLRRYLSFQNLLDIGRFFIGFFQALWHLFWFMPDAVFVKGGAVSVAPAMIAKLFFIPVFMHESDSTPGLANVIIGKIAKLIFISFRSAEKNFKENRVVFSGNPTRAGLMAGNKVEARKFFDLPDNRPTLLILGGSQGAKIINETVLSGLVVLSEGFNIIHQCGENQFDTVKNSLDMILKEGVQKYSQPIEKYYRCYPFLNGMELSLAYSLCDLIISRAGAGTLFEIAQLAKPAIIIPISKSTANHQYLNALEFSLHGGAVIEEASLNSVSLVNTINLILNQKEYEKRTEEIKTFATPRAADIVAEHILKHLI